MEPVCAEVVVDFGDFPSIISPTIPCAWMCAWVCAWVRVCVCVCGQATLHKKPDAAGLPASRRESCDIYQRECRQKTVGTWREKLKNMSENSHRSSTVKMFAPIGKHTKKIK